MRCPKPPPSLSREHNSFVGWVVSNAHMVSSHWICRTNLSNFLCIRWIIFCVRWAYTHRHGWRGCWRARERWRYAERPRRGASPLHLDSVLEHWWIWDSRYLNYCRITTSCHCQRCYQPRCKPQIFGGRHCCWAPLVSTGKLLLDLNFRNRFSFL